MQTQTQWNLIVKPNQKGRICNTPISHWLRFLGYVGFEFTLQITFGAKNVFFVSTDQKTLQSSKDMARQQNKKVWVVHHTQIWFERVGVKNSRHELRRKNTECVIQLSQKQNKFSIRFNISTKQHFWFGGLPYACTAAEQKARGHASSTHTPL